MLTCGGSRSAAGVDRGDRAARVSSRRLDPRSQTASQVDCCGCWRRATASEPTTHGRAVCHASSPGTGRSTGHDPGPHNPAFAKSSIMIAAFDGAPPARSTARRMASAPLGSALGPSLPKLSGVRPPSSSRRARSYARRSLGPATMPTCRWTTPTPQRSPAPSATASVSSPPTRTSASWRARVRSASSRRLHDPR